MYLKLCMKFLGNVCSFSDRLCETRREDAHFPIFCLEWTHPQSKLLSGTFLLLQGSRQNVVPAWEFSSVSSAFRACRGNFCSGFSSNTQDLCLHFFHNFLWCKTSYPCVSVVIHNTAAWQAGLAHTEVCVQLQGEAQRAAVLCPRAHPHL